MDPWVEPVKKLAATEKATLFPSCARLRLGNHHRSLTGGMLAFFPPRTPRVSTAPRVVVYETLKRRFKKSGIFTNNCMNIIEINGLSKHFKNVKAVDGISLQIREGEIFGLLGPNGAGKTTLISMLCTLLDPTSGTATVNGHDIITKRSDVRRSLGVVFQDPSLDEDLTAFENMEMHGRLYKVPKQLRKERIPELLKMVELEEKKDLLEKTFSGGMKRRLEIARGLLHHPKVLILDEPTIGLDPQTRRHMWSYIRRLNKEEHTTIIITTHYMDEADLLCERIAIVDNGKVIALDTPKKLKEQLKGDIVTVDTNDGNGVDALEKLPFVKSVKKEGSRMELRVENGAAKIPEIVKRLEKAGIVVVSVDVHKPTLEDVFLHFTGKELRSEKADMFARHRMMHMR